MGRSAYSQKSAMQYTQMMDGCVHTGGVSPSAVPLVSVAPMSVRATIARRQLSDDPNDPVRNFTPHVPAMLHGISSQQHLYRMHSVLLSQ